MLNTHPFPDDGDDGKRWRAEHDLATLMEDQNIRADQDRLAAAVELARELGIDVS